MSKRDESKELAYLVEEFKKGNRIEIPLDNFKSVEAPFNPHPSGHRCIICDWCQTDNRSLFNPEMGEYGSNRLVVDWDSGDMICRYCLAGKDQYHTNDYTIFDETRESLGGGGYRKKPIFYD